MSLTLFLLGPIWRWPQARTGQSSGSLVSLGSSTDVASKSRVDIVGIQDGVRLDLANPIILEGAHGEEIVRSLLVNDQVRDSKGLHLVTPFH